MDEQNPKLDAPGQDELNPQQPPATPPAETKTPPPGDNQPKVEFKDGALLVDGRKYVKESDLIAAKESLQGRLEEAQTAHNTAVDGLRLEVSQAQTEVAKANAALEEAKAAQVQGGISEEEVSRIKQESVDAKTKLSETEVKTLDYRRKYIMTAYNIPEGSDTAQRLVEKDMSQLDSFEEALKALSTGRGGPGNYAIGGGGAGATPQTPMDRAKELIAGTPYRGVRNAPPNTPPENK